MKRLTNRYTDAFGKSHFHLIKPLEISICNQCSKIDCSGCSFAEAIEKLTDYEDTGLSPKEIKELINDIK